MKNSLVWLVLLSLLSLLSCHRILYTHEEVLNRYKTKQDVTKSFGAPNEKKTNDSTEEWLYKFETKYPDHSGKVSQNTTTVNVAEFGQYKRRLIFSFDKQGNITRSDFKGVTLMEQKPAPLRTVIVILASLVAGLMVLAAYLYNH